MYITTSLSSLINSNIINAYLNQLKNVKLRAENYDLLHKLTNLVFYRVCDL